MTKAELIETLASRAGVSKKAALDLLSAFVDIVTEKIKAGEKVTISGFGTFSISHRAARTGINPQTKEKIEIPALDVPKFIAGKTLKEAVKK